MRAPFTSPWLVDSRWLHELETQLLKFSADPSQKPTRPQRKLAATRKAGGKGNAGGGNVRILGLYGLLELSQSDFGLWTGGTSLREFGAAFDDAIRDPSVTSILIDVDSPGGTVPGVQETSDKIYQARGK